MIAWRSQSLCLLALALALGAACSDVPDAAPTASSGSGTAAGGSGASGGDVGGNGGDGGDAGSAQGGGGAGGGSTAHWSPGCTTGNGLAEGEHNFMLDGLSRRYVLRLPNNYDASKPWPLILALHGNGGSVDYWDVTSGPRNIRGVVEEDAVLIIAEAIDGKWRDYDMPANSWPARIEQELLYFDTVLTEAKNELCLNESSIFSMGFSGGGSFSGVLGCRRTDIRGIAVGGSVIYFDENSCVNTPAAWITIGELELSAGREAYRDFFRDRAMCAASLTPTDPKPCEAYSDCAGATPVHYCEHSGDHIWPDFGSAAMWSFFEPLIEP